MLSLQISKQKFRPKAFSDAIRRQPPISRALSFSLCHSLPFAPILVGALLRGISPRRSAGGLILTKFDREWGSLDFGGENNELLRRLRCPLSRLGRGSDRSSWFGESLTR